MTVTAVGRIESESIEQSTGFERLDKSCLEAVQGKSMIPATENGRPIKSSIELPIVWSISGSLSRVPVTQLLTCGDIDRALASASDAFFDGWTEMDFQSRENPDRCLAQGSIFGIPASIKRVRLLRAQAVRTHARAVDSANRIALDTEAIRLANLQPLVQKTGSLSTDAEVANAAALFRSCQPALGSEACAKRDMAFARLKMENVCVTIKDAEELRVYLCDRPAEYYVASGARHEIAPDVKADSEQAKLSDDEWFKRKHAARASDREVRIFFSGLHTTGDTIPADAIIEMLFTKEACSLDVDNAGSMHRAWKATGAYQLGCWFPIQEEKWFFVGQIESLTHEGGGFWPTFPRALLHKDGSATITEPDYDSRTFVQAFLSNRAMHMMDHLHDKP